MDAAAFVEIGRVARAHGLSGEVSVVMTGGLPESRLVGLEVWFVPPTTSTRSARVVGVRRGPKGPLFSFVGVTDITGAGELRGRVLLARAADLPDVEEHFDPRGLEVLDAERGDVGEVVDVIVTGANDVWVVEGRFGQVLVPVVDEVVRDVDADERIARVTLIPGLIDGD